MPRKQHTHKYELRQTENRPVWTCALMGCNHFMPSHLTSLVRGRTSICWDCDMPFVLNELNMKADKPKCDDCSGLKNRVNDINAFITGRTNEFLAKESTDNKSDNSPDDEELV